MKKALALLIALALSMTVLAGCGGDASSVSSEAESVVEAAVSSMVEDDELYSQDVDLVNSTGVAIVEVYISKSDVDNWEEELLDGRSFASGTTRTFVTDELGTEDTTWDFLIVDEDGDEMAFFDLNLSSAVELEFHWGDGTTPSVTVTNADGSEYTEEGLFREAEYFSQNVMLYNGLGVTIYELYISPSDDDMWGVDLLEGREFVHDETRPFYTELVGRENATWDIKIVDGEGDSVTFPGVNFSASEVIALGWDGDSPTAYML